MPLPRCGAIAHPHCSQFRLRLTQFALKCLIEDGRQQGIEFSSGFGLQVLERIYFALEVVEVGDYAALFGKRGNMTRKRANNCRVYTLSGCASDLLAEVLLYVR